MDLTPIMQMVSDLITKLVPQKTGTKFLSGLGCMTAVVYLAANEIGTEAHVYAVCGAFVIYTITDLLGKLIEKRKDGGS